MSKFRNFTFTFHNYPDTVLVDTIECRYVIYGKEVCPKTGTPHLQGFIQFQVQRSLKSAFKALPGCHVEVARTTVAASVYCKKEGCFVERGIPPVSKEAQGVLEKNRWKRILTAAEEGNVAWLREEEPQVYLLHDRAIERAYKRARPCPQTLEGQTKHCWYYGPPGTGKSRKARDEHPNAYIKDPKSHWWDGYNNESTVIIDDFDKYQVSQGGDMKRWLDRYPFQAQHKGGSQLIRPESIIVTSNYHPEDIWEDDNTLGAICRRVKLVHFPSTPFNVVHPPPAPGCHPSFIRPDKTLSPKKHIEKNGDVSHSVE
nr:MAG: hypothetical protein [Crogonang virus 131]